MSVIKRLIAFNAFIERFVERFPVERFESLNVERFVERFRTVPLPVAVVSLVNKLSG